MSCMSVEVELMKGFNILLKGNAIIRGLQYVLSEKVF